MVFNATFNNISVITKNKLNKNDRILQEKQILFHGITELFVTSMIIVLYLIKAKHIYYRFYRRIMCRKLL